MNIIVTDTHALYWFLIGDKRLSKKAKTAIEEASRVVIPTIVLLELYYLLEKKKRKEAFVLAFEKFKNEGKYILVSLDVVAVEEVIKVSSALEMHDSIIVATAKMIEAPIVTKDRSINQTYKKTIW